VAALGTAVSLECALRNFARKKNATARFAPNSANGGEEPVRAVEEAFGSSSCGTTTADVTFSGVITSSSSMGFGGGTNGVFTSPSSYDNCFRSYVVDINHLQGSAGNGSGGGSATVSAIKVQWAAEIPTTKAACEKAWGGAIFYKKVGASWVDQTGQIDVYGTWASPSGGCLPPSISSPPALTLTPGDSYRVAATMRPSYADSHLRAIAFSTPILRP